VAPGEQIVAVDGGCQNGVGRLGASTLSEPRA
jgi:hypothetical protein